MSSKLVQLVDLRREIVDNGLIGGAKYVLWCMGDEREPPRGRAVGVLHKVLNDLLWARRWGEAGVLLWGIDVWNPRVKSVREIIEEWDKSRKLLVLGAGAQGKSWTLAGLHYMDWRAWPAGTTCKVISQSYGHAEKNIFASISTLHQTACIPIRTPDDAKGWIKVDGKDLRHGIQQVAIAKGASGEGILKGFHPIPMDKPHKFFGKMDRVRALVDEGEHCAKGVWTGLDNMLLSVSAESTGDNERIAVVTNPADVTSEFARRAENEIGWMRLEPDRDFKWLSVAGYDVLRLDAKWSENVMTGKLVYAGFQTADGFAALVRANGADSVMVATLGRGMYPKVGAIGTVFSPVLVDRMIGRYQWIGLPQPIGSLDGALMGDDSAILTTGLVGMASHYFDREGKMFPVVDGPRRAILVEQHVRIAKGDSVAVAGRVHEVCRRLGIPPYLFACDVTGTTEGIGAQLRSIYGTIIPVIYSQAASDDKMLVEDRFVASDRYANKATELWFGARAWADFDLIKVAPGAMSPELSSQAIARRYKIVGQGLVRMREKSEDLVNGKSPDYADSFTLIVEAARRHTAGALSTGLATATPPERAKATARERRAAAKVSDIQYVHEWDGGAGSGSGAIDSFSRAVDMMD